MARPADPRALDFAGFQAGLADALKGIEHPRVLAALALGEEAGEVLRCVLDAEGYGKDVKKALEGEVGDALVALTEVASRYGISLESAATAALSKIREKAPGWRSELSGRLDRMREAMDRPF
jgi:NTP pyrophosphatase (non-canonical NTP hydrolase)